jgi:hypothetical protein
LRVRRIFLFFMQRFPTVATSLGADYLSISRFSISNKKNYALNISCATSMWCLWKFRNSMIFNNTAWMNVK